MNRVALIFGALLVVPLLVLLAMSFGSDPRAIDSPLVGQPAPPFALADLDGKVVRLEDLRGQPVVINFWATWCQPCIVEHPMLLSAARQLEGRVLFLGVIYLDEPEAIRQFVARRGAWGPSLVDEGSEVAIAYGVYGAPETYVIDADGQVVEKFTGLLQQDALYATLRPLLGPA